MRGCRHLGKKPLDMTRTTVTQIPNRCPGAGWPKAMGGPGEGSIYSFYGFDSMCF